MLGRGQLGKCTISTKRPLPNTTRWLKNITVPSYLTIPLYTTLPYKFEFSLSSKNKINGSLVIKPECDLYIRNSYSKNLKY